MSGGNSQYTTPEVEMKKLYKRYNKLPEYWKGYVDAIFERYNAERRILK
jgi:hypothetical protein